MTVETDGLICKRSVVLRLLLRLQMVCNRIYILPREPQLTREIRPRAPKPLVKGSNERHHGPRPHTANVPQPRIIQARGTSSSEERAQHGVPEGLHPHAGEEVIVDDGLLWSFYQQKNQGGQNARSVLSSYRPPTISKGLR